MYKAVIVGCGKAGALKPDEFDSPSTGSALTHAHAIHDNPDIELLGIVDAKEHVARNAVKKWGAKRWKKEIGDPDVVVISTESASHFEATEQMLSKMNRTPKLIIYESPVGRDYFDCKKIMSRIEGVPVAVNYQRRYEPRHQDAASSMRHISIGKGVYGCRVLYSGCLAEEGGHALDLMRWWFGSMRWSYITHRIKKTESDMSFGFAAGYERCPQVVFTPVDSKMITMLEIEAVSSVGEYAIKNDGTKVILRPTEAGHGLCNRPKISKRGTYQKTHIQDSLMYLYKNAVRFLQGDERLKCTPHDALAVWEDYGKIIGN